MMLRHYCKTENCRRYANLNQDGFCPVCQPPETSTNECVDNCGICRAEIKDEISKSIGCDSCGKWFHAECAGPTALIDLITEAVKHSPEKPLLGLLLWFCPDCTTRPVQDYKIGESKYIHVLPPSMTNSASEEPKKTMQEKSYGPMCENYSNNICKFGISGKGCSSYHPKMCRRYIKFGPHGKRGCNKGSACSYFHPRLCNKSMKPVSQRICTNQSCGFFHLPRTKRHLPPVQRDSTIRGPGQSSQSWQSNLTSQTPNMSLHPPGHAPDHFLGNLIRNLVKESIQKELTYFQNQTNASPFLPGMSHFTQPWSQMPPSDTGMNPHQLSGPPPTQSSSQWGL